MMVRNVREILTASIHAMNEIFKFDSEGFGDSQQGIKRGGSVPIFQEREKYHGQTRFFRQFFLAEFCLLAICANVLAKDAALS